MIFIDDSSEKVTETVPGLDILQLLISLIERVLTKSSGIFILLVRKLQKEVLREIVGSLLLGLANWGTGENIKVLLAVFMLSRFSCCYASARTGLGLSQTTRLGSSWAAGLGLSQAAGLGLSRATVLGSSRATLLGFSQAAGAGVVFRCIFFCWVQWVGLI